jgi:5-methylcytosine-specific restriction endonuclease McrA
MKSKRSKACDISQAVKMKVWERDNQQCIICHSRTAMPNAHYIPRSQGGLGVEQNIVTLCQTCHHNYYQTDQRPIYKEYIKNYLKSKYADWSEENLIYKK